MLRFLADESCDYAVVRALTSLGHEVLPVAELSPRADDAAGSERRSGRGQLFRCSWTAGAGNVGIFLRWEYDFVAFPGIVASHRGLPDAGHVSYSEMAARAARSAIFPIQSAPPQVIDRMRTVRISSLTSKAMTPFPALGIARRPGEISSRLVPRQGFSPRASASASRAATFLATDRGVVKSSRKATMRAMSLSTSGCRTTSNRIIAATHCQHPFEDPREISRGVFHELLVRSFRTAADFFRHRLQYDFALGLFVPEPLNTRGDHGAYRREFAPLHHHLGESVVFVDEGDGGFDGHVATVSRSHTTINAGHGSAGISANVTRRLHLRHRTRTRCLDSGEPEESEPPASTPSIPGGATAMGSTSLDARPTGRVRSESVIGLDRNTQLEEKPSRAHAVVATSGLRSISRRSGCSASIETVTADLRALILAETLSGGMDSGGAFGTAVNPGTTP